MKSRIILLTILYISGLLGCSSSSDKGGKTDPFYTEKGEWDSARLPLLKPYEADKVDKRYGWIINLEGYDGDTGYSNVKKVKVINGMILTYSTNTILHGQQVKEAWHVIIPKTHIEKGFPNHKGYVDYLISLGVEKEPALIRIEEIAEYYERHDVIEWSKLDKNTNK